MGSDATFREETGNKRQLRKRRVAVDVQARYQQLRIEYPEATAGAIRRTLAEEFKGKPNDIPSERTIREWLKRDGVPPEARPWSLGSMEHPERTAAVVSLLRQIEPGQWWPNEDEAWWCSQLLPVVPDAVVPTLARLYWLRSATGTSTQDLDEFVAFAPWDADRAVTYQAAIDEGAVNPPGVQLQQFFNGENLNHQAFHIGGARLTPEQRKAMMAAFFQVRSLQQQEEPNDAQG